MILIVDDAPENIISLKKVLEVNGFEVDTASSGEEALKKIDAVNADSVAEIIDRVLDSSTMCISAVGPVNNVENLFELD